MCTHACVKTQFKAQGSVYTWMERVEHSQNPRLIIPLTTSRESVECILSEPSMGTTWFLSTGFFPNLAFGPLKDGPFRSTQDFVERGDTFRQCRFFVRDFRLVRLRTKMHSASRHTIGA